MQYFYFLSNIIEQVRLRREVGVGAKLPSVYTAEPTMQGPVDPVPKRAAVIFFHRETVACFVTVYFFGNTANLRVPENLYQSNQTNRETRQTTEG